MATRVVGVNDVLDGHVGPDLECLDRIYLNGWVASLQVPGQVVGFLTRHLGFPIPSPALLERIGLRFRKAVIGFAVEHEIPVVRFVKGQRKVEVMRPYLEGLAREGRTGVAAIGVAQEFQRVFTGTTYDGAHPTVGGLVLFGRHPQAQLESSRVVGALAGDDIGNDFVDRKDIDGPLLSVIAEIETFLRLHLETGHEIVGFEKEKREEIPMAALREAVVNALVHRDYTIAGPTHVFVLSDRVEVRSPGRPPNSVDAEAMRACTSPVTRTSRAGSWRPSSLPARIPRDTADRPASQAGQRHQPRHHYQRRGGCRDPATRTRLMKV